MDLNAYTLFYCTVHNNGFIVENIQKNVPYNFCDCDQKIYACTVNDIGKIGYITLNKNNRDMTYDMNSSNIKTNIKINLNTLAYSIYNKNFEKIDIIEVAY